MNIDPPHSEWVRSYMMRVWEDATRMAALRPSGSRPRALVASWANLLALMSLEPW
jgi:hypothetical protein